jgi:hypothetical protein
MATEKPKGAEKFDEQYWRAFRARTRKRVGMQGLLLIGPIGIAVCILRIIDPVTHPAGDSRNSLAYTLLINGGGIVLFTILIALSVWGLRRDRRQRD